MLTNDESNFEIIVTDEDRIHFKRLDLFLVHHLPQLSRSLIKKLFESEAVSCEQNHLELKKMPAAGSRIEIEIPPPISQELMAEDIPLDILFEDPYLIIVNKPCGLVVHPAPGNYQGTLVNALLHHCQDLKGIGQVKRPGIVHRLDRGTSGVMVVAKEQKTHEKLVELFSTHDIERRYECISFGLPRAPFGKIETQIGRHPINRLKMKAQVKNGKRAITHYKVIKNYQKLTHLELKLETGRTHQIRVHLSEILHTPILCDPLYADVSHQRKNVSALISDLIKEYPHQLLHAKSLGFIHPQTKENLIFHSDPPDTFKQIINILESTHD